MTKQLKKIRKYDKEMHVLDLEIQYLENGIFTKSTLTDTKVTGGKKADMVDRYNKQIERKEELKQQIESLLDARAHLIRGIDRLEDPEQRMILKMEYVNGMDVYDIGEFMEISKATFYVYRRQALKALSEIWEF